MNYNCYPAIDKAYIHKSHLRNQASRRKDDKCKELSRIKKIIMLSYVLINYTFMIYFLLILKSAVKELLSSNLK